jgi:eukaryotic-like serine/threonine-protein kinase
MSSTDVRIQLPERYRVVRHVANGGMASVWAAEDSILGRLVAVKVLAQHISADPGARTRFEREARTAAKVSDHPNVATIYDVGEHAGVPFIVMELFNGGSVADRMRTGTVPRSQALTWLAQAAAALDYAHGEGIVHRDVKPANLLLDDRGRVAVGDFGIARMVEDSSLTQAGQVLGTAAYLSPEQALGKDATDASDRYALAIVAFELLTGRRPFQGEHIAAQARQHVEDAPPTTELGPEVDEVLHRGMAKDPDERYLTAGRFVEELQHAVQRAAGPPTEATRPVTRTRRATPVAAAPLPPDPPTAPAPAYTPQAGRGNRRGVVLLAALGALALAAAVIALIASSGGDDPSANRAGNDEPAPTQTQDTEPQQTQTQEEEPRSAQEEEPAPPAPAPDNEGEEGPGPDTSGESPAALNDRGFAMLESDPAGAVPVLEAAVKGFEEQGDSANRTTYGYALYNLGQAYLKSGRPDDAIPMFERRLQVNPSDRPEVVRAAIDQAEAQLGQGGEQPGNGNGKAKKDKD